MSCNIWPPQSKSSSCSQRQRGEPDWQQCCEQTTFFVSETQQDCQSGLSACFETALNLKRSVWTCLDDFGCTTQQGRQACVESDQKEHWEKHGNRCLETARLCSMIAKSSYKQLHCLLTLPSLEYIRLSKLFMFIQNATKFSSCVLVASWSESSLPSWPGCFAFLISLSFESIW